MPTRLYTRSSGTPGVIPTSWAFANQINPVSVPGTTIQNDGSVMTTRAAATSTTNPIARAMGRTIWGPLAGQTIGGSIKGQMRAMENNAGANATLALAVKLVQPNGADRGVLLTQTASDSATAGNELVVNILTNAQFKNVTEATSMALTSQAAQAGDYLVIEWGFRAATATSRTITVAYGNDQATDLGENTTETTAFNPWWEFSQTILENERVANLAVTQVSQTLAATGTAYYAGQFPFASTTTVVLPGAIHQLGTAHLLIQVYDDAVPARQVAAAITVDPTTFDVTVTFLQPQSGLLVLSGDNDLTYGESFVGQTTLTVLGTTHALGTAALLIQLYDATGTALAAPLTVHPTTYDVTATFLQPQSGRIVLGSAVPSGSTPHDGLPFTNQTTVTLPGTTHDRQTANLLVQVYDAGTPPRQLTSQITIDSVTDDVTATFLQPQSGRLIVGGGTVGSHGTLSLPQASQTGTSASTLALRASVTGATAGDTLASTGRITLTGTALLSQAGQVAAIVTRLAVQGTYSQPQAAQGLMSVSSIGQTGRNVAIAFVAQTTVTFAGVVHAIGHPHLRVQIYDASTPRRRLRPGTLSIHPTTFDVTATFLQPQSGLLVLNGGAPDPASLLSNQRYPFTNQTTVLIPGPTHGFGTDKLLVDVYDTSTPAQLLLDASVTVHASTYDIGVTFLQPQSGTIIVCGAADTGFPNTGHPFTNQTTAVIPGPTHLHDSDRLGVSIYDTSTPRLEIRPGAITIHPTTFDVTATFLQPQSGTMVLNGSVSTIQATVSLGQGPQISLSTSRLALAAQATILQGNQTATANTALALTASVAVLQAPQSLAALGTLPLVGTVTGTQAAQSSVSTSVLALQAALSQAQEDQDVSSTGGSTLNGSLAAVQAAQSLASPASLLLQASVVQGQAGQQASSTGTLTVQGTASFVQGPATSTSAGLLFLAGSLSGVQGPQTLTSTTSVLVQATATCAQSAQTVQALGSGPGSGILGVATLAQGAHTSTGTSQVLVGASLVGLQVSQTGSATSTLRLAATGTLAQSAQLASSVGTLALQGSTITSQAAQTLLSTATSLVGGSSTLVQAAQTSTSQARVAVTGLGLAVQTGQTVNSVATLTLRASVTLGQAGQTLTSLAGTLNRGTLLQSQEEQELSSTGQLRLAAQSLMGQAAQVSLSTAALQLQALTSTTQAPHTVQALGTGPGAGLVGIALLTQAPQGGTSTGALLLQATSQSAQAAQTGSSTGTAPRVGTIASLQDAQLSVATASAVIRATLLVVQDNQPGQAFGLGPGLHAFVSQAQASQLSIGSGLLALTAESLLASASQILASQTAVSLQGSVAAAAAGDTLVADGSIAPVLATVALVQAAQTVAASSVLPLQATVTSLQEAQSAGEGTPPGTLTIGATLMVVQASQQSLSGVEIGITSSLLALQEDQTMQAQLAEIPQPIEIQAAPQSFRLRQAGRARRGALV